MGEHVGCVLNAAEASPEAIEGLVSRLGVTSLFLRGAVCVPGLRSKAPAVADDGAAPGLRLTDDDSELRAALGAARRAGVDAFLILTNPLVGRPGWSDLLAEDNTGRSASAANGETPTLCPTRPKLAKWVATAAGEVARVYKPAGVLLEDFSLGPPGDVETLFMCWCDRCQASVGDLGYDADRVRLAMQGARSKLESLAARIAGVQSFGIAQFIEGIGFDTGLLEWLNFRADSVSTCLLEARKALAETDTGVRVGVLFKSPTAAMLAGQRRADALRDATLADFFVPVVCGGRAEALDTIAGHARAICGAAPDLDEAAALQLAARVHGYAGAPLPDTIGEMAAPAADLLAASAERELALVMAASGAVPCWPAIDVAGLPAELVADVAGRIADGPADGLLYIGVPQ